MVTSSGAAPLVGRIVDVLASTPDPMKARDIADRLGPPGDSELRREVSRALYGPLQAFVRKDPEDRWTLVRRPNVASGPGRKQPQSATTSHRTTGAPAPVLPVVSIDPGELNKIQATIDLWKRELIEFGKRNKLLYFNSSRRTCLRLLAPEDSILYEGLVLHDKTFAFATPAAVSIDEAELEQEGGDHGLAERQGDIVVDYETSSAKDVRSLQRKLFRLRSDARTVLDEQGINTLHLALGVLRWRESDSAQSWVESPLVLVPASLARDQVGYRLSGFEGDVVVNPALVHRLRHDFELELPSFEPFDGFGEEANLPGYLGTLESLVLDRGWQVSREAWLSHFSFEKLVMYEDLSQPGTAEAAAENDVLSAICDVRDPDVPEVSLETLDDDFELPETFPVVDADSSQLEVMARVKAGQSLVVQGPPGTGKSQTIVNLIPPRTSGMRVRARLRLRPPCGPSPVGRAVQLILLRQRPRAHGSPTPSTSDR